jgi:hypothetical protein
VATRVASLIPVPVAFKSAVSQIIFQMSVTGVIIYFGRNLIYLVPFPLHKYHGFDHFKVKEVTSAALLSTFLVMFQLNMTERILYFKKTYV